MIKQMLIFSLMLGMMFSLPAVSSAQEKKGDQPAAAKAAVDKHADKPAEKAPEKPAAEKPAGKPGDKPADAGAGQPMMPKSAVLVEKVFSRPSVIDKKYVGVIEAINTVVSVTRVSGDIMNVAFHEGDLVKEGELLFEIDDVRYAATVKSAEARIEQVKARIQYAEASYKRNLTLYKEITGVSEDEVESVASTLASAKAELRALEAELILSKDDLQNTKIYSKITGRAGRLPHSKGNYVTPASGALITVVQMDPIYIRFSMSEKDFISMFGNVDNLKKTATVVLQLADGTFYKNGDDAPMKGEIMFIDNAVKTSLSSVSIWASFKNPTERLNPGGIAGVHLTKTDTTEYPVVKSSAIMFTQQGTQIYVLGPGDVPELRTVTLGATDSGGVYRAITNGLKVGETVIIDGMHKIMTLPNAQGQMQTLPVAPMTEAARDAMAKEASVELKQVKDDRAAAKAAEEAKAAEKSGAAKKETK